MSFAGRLTLDDEASLDSGSTDSIPDIPNTVHQPHIHTNNTSQNYIENNIENITENHIENYIENNTKNNNKKYTENNIKNDTENDTDPSLNSPESHSSPNRPNCEHNNRNDGQNSDIDANSGDPSIHSTGENRNSGADSVVSTDTNTGISVNINNNNRHRHQSNTFATISELPPPSLEASSRPYHSFAALSAMDDDDHLHRSAPSGSSNNSYSNSNSNSNSHMNSYNSNSNMNMNMNMHMNMNNNANMNNANANANAAIANAMDVAAVGVNLSAMGAAGPSSASLRSSSRSSSSNIVDWRAMFGTADDAEENEDFSFSIVTKNVFQDILNMDANKAPASASSAAATNSLATSISGLTMSGIHTFTAGDEPAKKGAKARHKARRRESADSASLFYLDAQGDDDHEETFNYCAGDHAARSFPIFLDLWKNQQVCDVKLTLEEHVFHCHRVVLCATIPYFYTMFTTDMVEKEMTDIVLHSPAGTTIDTQAFGAILKYAYTGAISINKHNVHALLIAANFLGLLNVQNACSEYLKRRLSTGNVLALKGFAFTLGLESLLVAIDRYIYCHFEEIAANADFVALQLNELSDILERDELNVAGEASVFEAVMAWTRHEADSRKASLASLLQKVRLPLLSPEYIVDHVLSEPLIRNSLICRELVDEAKDYHLLPARRQLMKKFRTRPRYGHHVQGLIFAVGIAKNGELLSTVEVYDPHSARWTMAEAMSIHRSRVGVAVMDAKLYAIGGYNGQERLSTVEVYDCQTERWTRVTPMEHRRSAVGAAALEGHLYVCGGYNSSTSLNVVERYSPASGRWKEVAPMNYHRSAAGVVALDGFIYVLGGHDGMAIFDSVERYDAAQNRWEMVRSMNSKRCRLGVAAFNGKIYVCGGYDGSRFLKSAEVYDPATAQWTYIQSMQVTRSRVALTANCGKLWAIGGYDGTGNLSSVETYDVELDRWQFVESMVAHEGGVAVGVIPNKS